MSDTDTCPTPDGLDDKAKLALALLFQEIADTSSLASIQLWCHSVEDAVLDFTDEPAVPLDALSSPELHGIHPILCTAAAACADDKPLLQWLVDLGRMITDLLQAREAEQMLIDAKAAAINAEETARDRANREPENLDGLSKWSELTGPKPDAGSGVKAAPPQRVRRVAVVALSEARRKLADACRRLVTHQGGAETGRIGKP